MNYTRLLGFRGNPWVQSTVCLDPLPELTAAAVDSVPGRGKTHARRDLRIESERSNSGDPPQLDGICVERIPGSKKGWRPKASHKPKMLNGFIHTEHFKMEGIYVLKDLLGDWMAKVDLKGHIFHGRDS